MKILYITTGFYSDELLPQIDAYLFSGTCAP